MKNIQYLLFVGAVFVFSCVLMACDRDRNDFRIGVSQCSDDEWRSKMNEEMKREAAFLGNIDVVFRSAYDDSERQCADIDSLVDEKVDLLIVAPNEARGVTAAVRRARRKGIPVIMVDRKLDADEYDAYVGADNFEIGYKAGVYVATALGGHGRVVEIMGLRGSTPAMERHNGFVAALSEAPGISLVASVDGKWRSEDAAIAVDSLLPHCPNPDFIFSHNDRMAVGARSVMSRYGKTSRFIGVDAVPGKGYGVELVRNGILEASLIYTTGGDKIIQLADSLLKKQKIQRNTLLSTALVDSTNARVVAMQVEQITNEEQKIEALNNRIDTFLLRYNNQKALLMACIVILFLVCIVFVLILRAYWTNVKTNKMLEAQKEKLETQRNQLALLTKQLAAMEPVGFAEKLRETIDSRLSNPDFGVEELAAELGVGRSQLFRKVKSLCGCSPVELLRAARLKRAAELLTKTDKTVAEIAFASGFSSPSYFAKCYKDYFGENPKAAHKH